MWYSVYTHHYSIVLNYIKQFIFSTISYLIFKNILFIRSLFKSKSNFISPSLLNTMIMKGKCLKLLYKIHKIHKIVILIKNSVNCLAEKPKDSVLVEYKNMCKTVSTKHQRLLILITAYY